MTFHVPIVYDQRRQALGLFVAAMAEFLAACGLDIDADGANLSVNFDGRGMRVDVARLNAAGRLDEIVVSLAADPLVPDMFGQEIGLPAQPGGQMH